MHSNPRHDWTRAEIRELFALPFNDLLFRAHSVHRQNFDPNQLQISTLCSIKTGACPENCKYCAQSGHYNTGLEKEKLIEVDKVLEQARQAKASGATRFCMGAAWRSPPDKEMPKLMAMVQGVKALGMESCITLGMLNARQAQQLADAGLDYYNHNLDTSPEYYGEIITTRTYQDRLETLQNVRDVGVKVCCGGILGMGETPDDHVGLLHQLATLQPHPESVPINMLMRIQGSPLENAQPVDPFQFIRTIAVARILMPKSRVRLAAGRENMHEEAQALAYFAGANSIFYGEKLLTTRNPSANRDVQLLKRLGMRPEVVEQEHDDRAEDSALLKALAQREEDDLPYYDAAL
ncbi:biotin synthase BioB [Gilvimarinus sp. F26214L]|uniref:biotin synthase BioB n=1 Tax=Gilvimarinus sp. DZF01 TaxID=3461371 RepID=UPI0040464522